MFGANIADYELNSVLAQCCGGAAVVYTAVHKPSGETVAVKRFYLDRVKESANHIQQEILTTRQLQHPNILPYYSTFVNGLDLYIISPLLSFGSCRDLINRSFNEGLPEMACCIILRDTLQGLDYIHKKGYIHRGIRASHILVCSSGLVCVSGLRSAGSLLLQGRRQRALHSLPPPGTSDSSLPWLSPELLEQNLRGYDESSDVYSVGMLSCELGNGAIPFSDIPSTLMLTEKVRGNTPQLLDCTTFPHNSFQEEEVHESAVGDMPSSSSLHVRHVYSSRRLTDYFHQFTELCLEREPTNRPTPSQLLQHGFFKQIKKTDSLAQILHTVEPIECRSDNFPAVLLEDQLAEMNIESPSEWDF